MCFPGLLNSARPDPVKPQGSAVRQDLCFCHGDILHFNSLNLCNLPGMDLHSFFPLTQFLLLTQMLQRKTALHPLYTNTHPQALCHGLLKANPPLLQAALSPSAAVTGSVLFFGGVVGLL